MLSFVIRRIMATIPVMAIVALFVFSLLYIAPGDPAAIIAGDQATPDDVARIRASLGLDRPFIVRFAEWVWQILHGDLGTSIFTNLPVATMIAQRIEPTLSLMAVTLVLAIAIAVPIGVVAAWKADTIIDRAIMAIAVLGFSVPVFVVGYVLAYVFALELDWLPVQGDVDKAERDSRQDQIFEPGHEAVRERRVALHRQPIEFERKHVCEHIADHEHRHREAQAPQSP